MKRVIVAGAAIVASAALAACGGPSSPVRGRVTALRYDPPSDVPIMYCAGFGKYGCSVWLPMIEHNAPSWHVLIDGVDDHDKPRNGWRGVAADVYAHCAVDDHFEKESGCSHAGN